MIWNVTPCDVVSDEPVPHANLNIHGAKNFVFVIELYFTTLCVLLIFTLRISYLIAACDWTYLNGYKPQVTKPQNF